MSTDPRKIIGAMRNPNVRPGGFSSILGSGKRGPLRKSTTMRQVRDAANESLARRGASVQPDLIFDQRGSLTR